MRVLLVEDNSDAALAVSLLLGRAGHETRTAVDGPEALLAAAEFQPDAVLLDIRLPRMDGYEVARRLRSMANPDRMRIVAVSGVVIDRETAVAAGFDGHILKPAGIHEILRAMGATPARGR
jgi:CheY-like chemotaxis protein